MGRDRKPTFLYVALLGAAALLSGIWRTPVTAGTAESREPLPPGHEVIALYRAGRLADARKKLVAWVSRSAEAATQLETRREVDLRSKLAHSLAVNLTRHCFKLDREARGDAGPPQELLTAAKLSRETMEAVIAETRRLAAADSPLVTRRVTQARVYAESELAGLLVQEIDALKELRRWTDARRLNDRRHQLVRQFTADQMERFIHDALNSLTAGMTQEGIRRERQRLTMAMSDDFERWGEKLLAERRPLTHARIQALLKDPEQGLAWRLAFHGYLKLILGEQEPSDAYEIGLTRQDVTSLRESLEDLKP